MDVVTGRFFAVDVFARLHRPDRRQGVPVVGRGDGNGLDVGIGESLAHILILFGRLAVGILRQRGLCLFASRLVDVAQAGNAGFGQPGIDVEVPGPAAAQTDDRHVDSIVGAPHAHRRRSGGSSHEKPSGGVIRHFDSSLLARAEIIPERSANCCEARVARSLKAGIAVGGATCSGVF